ncbi:rhamnolipids biosynthesis 3-oxoacyl-reductase [Protomyces lactucae-debilis]|uniref:Rhamnolipids biosynthesis 3-oxoacyl-reductase n=1 Tax=Protomyces lactucae-debilis TaxID=2754530 RepID=A0A1Y2F3Z1_PROLT|nr:rhamnolipids biosynthesis 3-oxoacyl-reductase [Protomyces lactucae-debilis]ORY78620.1 rhamnolipids biosynthesis 3-oxoacyl-reductase [Protomyces lactucae-debilis]
MSYDYSNFNISDLFNVKGKVALITGGSSGLGLNMAHALVRNGAKVYISSRKQKQCDAAVAELTPYGEAVAISCDASKVANIEALVAKITEREPNGVHICIANAGAAWGAGLIEQTEESYDKVTDLNTKSVFFTIQKMMPLLEKAATVDDPARVIAIGSIMGLIACDSNTIPYNTSKAAVHHMVRSLCLPLGAKHITINSLSPGYFPSKMTKFILADTKDEKAANNAMGRLGLPQDMAGTCLFLCSRAGSYINGQTIAIDGGYIHQATKL